MTKLPTENSKVASSLYLLESWLSDVSPFVALSLGTARIISFLREGDHEIKSSTWVRYSIKYYDQF